MTRAKFVVFEGSDGAGKSTQVQLAAEWLRERGVKLLTTREPGGTETGEHLRNIVLGKDGERVEKETELFLMLAARREHVCKIIAPALARGEWVLCDRFGDSTRAYQGGGRGLSSDFIERASAITEHGARPDLTLYLIGGDGKNSSVPLLPSAAGDETFEQTTSDFGARVAAAYRDIAAANKNGITIRIEGKNGARRSKEEIAETIRAHLQKKFKL